jgi:peptide/nickel transport system substrate-binding protein
MKSSKQTITFFLLGCCFLVGCLSNDPQLGDADTSATNEQEAGKQTTTAPHTLDPSILESRAFGEAPILAERVRAGELPPVSERLPESPLVVVPMEEIGRYGGTLRRALTGDIVQTPGVSKTLNENLMGYEQPIPKSILYNLAKSHEFLDDGRIALFKIRKGIKWSDGVPFTVDDILFWYNDMTLNDDARANPLFPSAWLVEGKPIQMEKVDDLTLRITSHQPLGRILNLLCTDWIAFPKHILADQHPKYNATADFQALKDSTTTAQMLYNPRYPRISAWAPVEWSRGQRIVYERNPYYYKVDSAGNQLPYADRLVFNVIQDTQVILLKFINGEIDFLGRYAQINMFDMMKSEERKGKFRVYLGTPVPVSTFSINWDAKRLPLRRAFRDKRVRIALSHAMNRVEIGEILYSGLLKPAGFAFAPASQFYSEEAAQNYITFDPELSRRLLDEAGYTDSDGDGVRELDDGTPFSLTIDVIPGMGVDVCQLVSDYWQNIGIKITLFVALRDIIVPLLTAGDFEIHWWWSTSDDALVKRENWGHMSKNTPEWHREAATEGPAWLHEATRLIEESGTTVDTAQVRRNMNQIRDLYAEHVPILIPGFAYHVWGASTRLGNVPEESTTADPYRGWSRPVFHEQIFIRKREKD